MDELDEHLRQLVEEACKHPIGSRQRRQGLTEVITLMTYLQSKFSDSYSKMAETTIRARANPIIPTVGEVQEFGYSIGICNITINPGYEKWWNVLHEIGHFAVKPDSYIAQWRQCGGLTVPYMNWFSGDG